MTDTKPDTGSFNSEDSEALANLISSTLNNRKAERIVVMDLREITTLADFFVVCSGLSDVHVKSLSNEVSIKVKEQFNEKPWNKEGLEGRRWVVLDYVNVVVHIFNNEARGHYALEKMWSDAKVREITD